MKAARRLSKSLLKDKLIEKEEEVEIKQSMKDTDAESPQSATGTSHLAPPTVKDPSISESAPPSRGFLRRASSIVKPSGAPTQALKLALKGRAASHNPTPDDSTPSPTLKRRITVDIPQTLKSVVKKGASNLGRSKSKSDTDAKDKKHKHKQHKRTISETLGRPKRPEFIHNSQSDPAVPSSPIFDSPISTFNRRLSAPVIVTTRSNTMTSQSQRKATLGSESVAGSGTVDLSDDGSKVQDAGAPVDPSDTIDFIDEIKIPALLQQGTPMLKISAKKGPKLRKFRLDPDQGQILWESRKAGIITIENIREMRAGADARNYREQFKIAADSEPRWLTIVYISDGKYKTLHVVALEQDVFKMWYNTLTKLYSLREELMRGLGNMERRQMVWEKQYWKGADSTGDQKLDFDEVEKMCRRLNIHTSRDDLLKKFQEADSSNKGYLNFPDFQKFVKLLKARPEVQRLYLKYSGENGKFDFAVFEKFMREAQQSDMSQPQLQKIFHKYTSTPGAAAADAPKVELSPKGPIPTIDPKVAEHGAPTTPEKKSISDPTPEQLSALAPHYETTDANGQESIQSLVGAAIVSATHVSTSIASPLPTPKPEADAVMTLDQFTSFLMSADNAPFMDHHGKIYHDMKKPLSEYYISSSHNTYLVGNQVMGDSTIEGYIRALLQGCRSVELDIWDGDQEPVIYHGRTLTTKVSVREVVRAIAKYAFVASPYPIIISAEIHCNMEQQEMVANIMKEEFGDAFITDHLPHRKETEAQNGVQELPSPDELKGKILLKAKNLFVAESVEIQQKGVAVDTESSTTETTTSSSESEGGALSKPRGLVDKLRGKAPRLLGTPSSPPTAAALARTGGTTATALGEKPKVKMSMALVALLVYTVGVKCRGFNKKEHYDTTHLFSLSERTANKILKQSMVDLIKHNRTHVVRVYPNGTRLKSTNFEPHRYWAAGAQLVALNWQTFDLGYMINYAMFQRNGKCGYVLKPATLRVKDKASLGNRTEHFLDVTIVSAQQLPRPKDEQGHEIIDKSIVDPFVTVSVHIPDWSTSPFLPEEQSQAVSYSPETDAKKVSGGAASSARTVSRRTGVVKNNGFNPIWEEKLTIPFDLLGGMKDLVFVRFEVREEDGDQDNPVAVYCISLGSLMMGYRHLPLHDQQMSQYLFSTLFVNVNIRDA
ncbi:Phospholipase C [Tulasnella sp. 418]|nr:Phospholipase C [Tulasnella sp. 418]